LFCTADPKTVFTSDTKDITIIGCSFTRGIEVRNNSVEEITAVVAEMEARLSGRQYTEAEESLQRKYRKILLGEVQKSYMHFINARIGTDFLQRNPWFLQ